MKFYNDHTAIDGIGPSSRELWLETSQSPDAFCNVLHVISIVMEEDFEDVTGELIYIEPMSNTTKPMFNPIDCSEWKDVACYIKTRGSRGDGWYGIDYLVYLSR